MRSLVLCRVLLLHGLVGFHSLRGATDVRFSVWADVSKMAAAGGDKSSEIMYIDGIVGPHVDIYE